jgi:hypothetical protein
MVAFGLLLSVAMMAAGLTIFVRAYKNTYRK